jgi:hypothetical protein
MNKLEIYDFYNIEEGYLIRLNNKILLNYPFIKYLNASNNKKITNIDHMNNLIELDAGWDCGITNKGLQKINLIILNANNNNKITNVNHMDKLIELDAGWNCGIDDNGSLACFSKLSNPN